jgi:hypothetical protein
LLVGGGGAGACLLMLMLMMIITAADAGGSSCWLMMMVAKWWATLLSHASPKVASYERISSRLPPPPRPGIINGSIKMQFTTSSNRLAYAAVVVVSCHQRLFACLFLFIVQIMCRSAVSIIWLSLDISDSTAIFIFFLTSNDIPDRN